MTFREAIIKSMRAYYKGVAPEKSASLSKGKMKYTKKYFDSVAKDLEIENFDLDAYKKKKGH